MNQEELVQLRDMLINFMALQLASEPITSDLDLETRNAAKVLASVIRRIK